MKKVIYLILIAFLGVLFTTNPSHVDHLKSVEKKFAVQNPILTKLGLAKTADIFTTYHNAYFFSAVMTNHIDDKEKQLVSFGIFGQVFVRDLDIDI